MDFEVVHTFDASRADVVEADLAAEFQGSLRDLGPLAERAVLSQERDADGTVVRRTRCVLDVELSGMARSILGDAKPAWIEEATWDPDEWTWRWVIQPEVAAELLSAHGTTSFSETDGVTARRVSGTVKVNVPLYGGKVERWIVTGIERTYQEEAARLQEWLRGAR
ncbi:MAG: DUF2505 family protein [Actinomycetota bacterium]